MSTSPSLALYRKYRSQNFDSVIGQSHVIDTLKNALKNNHISHAYLFTGPRGVGKTTVARLLARALNCLGDPRPCNQCAQCKIDLVSNLDLIEIDAASNRRIDEIRELRDKISLAPASGRYKVYIIDEVHMLTNEAFNALLKTLEEPPSHAIFILATTEAQKLPETIISRTQRFNFKPLNTASTEQGLAAVANQEKISIDSAALNLLASAGQGSLRDAIGMLDQVASSGSTPIDVSTVRKVLGWSEDHAIVKLSQSIIRSDPGAALAALDAATAAGTSVSQIISQLIARWRGILLATVGATTSTDSLIVQARSSLTLDQIIRVIDQLMIAGQSSLPTLALETAIIKLTATTEPTIHSASAPETSTALTAPPIPQARTSQPAPAAASNKALDLWPKALSLIKLKNNSLYALLSMCRTKFVDDKLELSCRFSFHRDRLEEFKNRQIIENALERIYGRTITVTAIVEANTPNPTEASNPESELISSALEILGGEVVDG